MKSPHEDCQQHPRMEDRQRLTIQLLLALLALVGYQVFFQNADLRNDFIRLEARVQALEVHHAKEGG